MVRVTSVVGHSRSSISVLTGFHVAPGPAGRTQPDPLAGAAFMAHDLTDAVDLSAMRWFMETIR